MEDWTSLGQHKRHPEFPVETRESRRNSRKTTWFPRHRKMKPFPATASQEKSHVRIWRSKRYLAPLMRPHKVPRHPGLPGEEHRGFPATLPLSPFSPPDLDRRVDSPALSGRGSRPSGRTSGASMPSTATRTRRTGTASCMASVQVLFQMALPRQRAELPFGPVLDLTDPFPGQPQRSEEHTSEL